MKSQRLGHSRYESPKTTKEELTISNQNIKVMSMPSVDASSVNFG